ncbi:hypothetical protein [uncultured Aeromicrobium sp.]|uniref:hypothetical protein n=1 Tax=uncultured Aeromicrobium sp. TaxID=337820 RepID=UPI0025F32904|nr:hypothetical protein [uncultured Aeromicrobium sp.]
MAQPEYTTIEAIRAALPDDVRDEAAIDYLLLTRASRIIDEALIGVAYRIDQATQMPIDEDVRQALDDATAAQAAWMILSGDEDGSGAAPGTPQSATVGRASWSGMGQAQAATTTRSGAKLAPEAARILLVEGLTPGRVRVHG